MTYGSTAHKPWIEAIPIDGRSSFSGRTFSRFHLLPGPSSAAPAVAEIWATSDHRVEAHAHDSDELMYVVSGAIEVGGRRLDENDVVFIPGGTRYDARVLSHPGARVLRIELPNARTGDEEPEYRARAWSGALTSGGLPDPDRSEG